MNYITDQLKNLKKALLYVCIIVFAMFAFQACDNDDDPSSPDITEDIVEIARADSNFSTLVSALEDAGLVSILQSDGPFTVFAPTNTAFDTLPDGLLDGLSNDQLIEILSYHVLQDEISSDDLEAEQTVESLSDDSLFITSNGTVIVNDTATVVEADIEASNGILHSVDRVLLPDGYSDIFDVILKRYTLDTLEEAIRSADLTSTLRLDTQDGYTVFAPTNEAFDNLPEDTLDGLSQAQLQDLLTYHVLGSTVFSSALSDSQNVETLNGDSLLIEVADGTVSITDNDGNTYQVTTADIEGNNGVVHIINGVLLPGQE